MIRIGVALQCIDPAYNNVFQFAALCVVFLNLGAGKRHRVAEFLVGYIFCVYIIFQPFS